ncbi:hypothetical protein BDN72DRAFT_840281 [Pluteus cervinus]|uniref:Uncharacterized protein n=1 Tax=Pluteus cervinus TaxID=181527 RepID=A0ACD3AW25_9AGAR|nr:hypothetical protein BDN72DRAFT_840281 [Pluteus cervinus]
MPSSSSTTVDDYPSTLWVTIPPILLISAYYIRKWYLARRLRVHGIGKGAPGFQTNVSKIRVTPEIAERLRRGEKVSPEEIAASAAKAESAPPPPPLPRGVFEEINETNGNMNGYTSRDRNNPITPSKSQSNVDTEWLPESITNPRKRGKAKKK